MRLLQVKIDDELHKRFKLAAVHEEIEMSELIRKWIESYVGKIEKKLKSK